MDYFTNQAVQLLKHHSPTEGNGPTDDTPIGNLPHNKGVMEISAAGERTLWITFAIMAVSTIVFGLFTLQQPRKMRLFPGQITVAITMFASIAYFAMAVHTGKALVNAPGHNAMREIFFARYLDWAVTTPLLLLDLALFAGLAYADILFLMVADLGMILTGLMAALDPHIKSRWGFYTFSCLFFLYVLWVLLYTASKTAYARHEKIGKAYLGIAAYTAILWTAYPVVWGFGEGVNFISSDSEVLLYAILDIAAKPGFGILLLALHAGIPQSNVALSSYWTEPQGASQGGGYGAIPQNE